ncbi:MAG: hypothetical protein VYE22_09785 [Myxococcota bacterium]|nr:hypothetical protein [Myxococcota bacterium]
MDTEHPRSSAAFAEDISLSESHALKRSTAVGGVADMVTQMYANDVSDAKRIRTNVRVRRDTFVRMAAQPIEVRRLLLLIEQLADECDRARGWPGRVAERTGLSLSSVRKYVDGSRTGVSAATLKKVRDRMHLEARFFHDESLGEPHYTNHVRGRAKTRPAAFEAFQRDFARFDELTDAQIEQLANLKFRGGPPSEPGVYFDIARRLLDDGGEVVRDVSDEAASQGVRRFRKERSE